MKRVILTLLCAMAINSITAQIDTIDLTALKEDISILQSNQNRLKKDVKTLSNKNRQNVLKIKNLESLNKDLNVKLDSLQHEFNKVADSQKADKTELSTQIGQTNEKVQATEETLSSRSIWGIGGIIVLLIALAITIGTFLKKFKSGSSSIDDVRKVQESLEKAQEKMQEETIQLDNKLIEILSKQSVAVPTPSVNGEIDHSLVLKVADEITKIEKNLSHMDKDIKGYKHLSRGVQRIKDNFMANDYEIVDMLGKPYQPGMKAAVTFVTDENLEPGQQIITRIIKPQVNYKQKMIQAAQIEVSQAE